MMRKAFQTHPLILDKVKTNEQAASNCIFVAPSIYESFKAENGRKDPIYIDLKGFIFILKAENSLPEGSIGVPGVIRSALKLSPVDDKPVITHYSLPKQLFMLSSLKFSVSCPTLKEGPKEIQEEVLIEYFRNNFKNHFMGSTQEFFAKIDGVEMVFKLSEHEFIDDKTNMSFGMFFEETNMEFKSKSGLLRIKSSSMKQKNIVSNQFKFEDLGVGGMDNQIIDMFRRAFSLRRLPPGVLEKYGKTHIKGVLLYGPPGTGKTLIAKELSKCLNAVKPEVVNGPELLSKFVGESEENVRKLFAPARKAMNELGEDSPLHVIIFDEFDAIAKPRGMDSDSTGVASNVVNQLLSMIDGVDSLNNILLIGMTNRKDMIDPAVIRPGRFELHIEIGLPDEAGRVQILRIHTKSMSQNDILGKDVDLKELASKTKNFTGSEIESLVKNAITHGLNRNHDLTDFTKELHFTKENTTVYRQDFMSALAEVNP